MAKRPTQPRPVAVKDILQGFLKPGDLEGLRVRQEIRRVWEAVVPGKLLARSRLLDLRRQELWVEVSDSHWAQELQFLKPRLLQELDRALGAGKVRDIRFRVGAFNQIREDTETS
jgi:hypothetical protein